MNNFFIHLKRNLIIILVLLLIFFLFTPYIVTSNKLNSNLIIKTKPLILESHEKEKIDLDINTFFVNRLSFKKIISNREEISKYFHKNKEYFNDNLEQSDEQEKNILDDIYEIVSEQDMISRHPTNQLEVSEEASSFKSYEDWRKITDTTTLNYKLSREATILNNGLLVIDEEYYCVAMGSYYGTIGDRLLIKTDEDNIFKVIIVDQKDDKHTDITNRYTLHNGCMLEFIIDCEIMNKDILYLGTVNPLGFSGKIISVEKLFNT